MAGSGRLRPRSALAAIAVAAALAATAYGGGKAGNSKVIIDGTTDSVTNIDPANIRLRLVHPRPPDLPGPDGFPPGATPEPVLATSAHPKGTSRPGPAHLRRNVKFHNGDAYDLGRRQVVVRPRRQDQGRPGIYTLLCNLKSMTTNGQYGVTFHLKKPQSTWPHILTTGAGYIVPKALYPANKILANTAAQSAPARTC